MTKAKGNAPRTQGRSLALQLLYSYEQNHYKDDGQLLPEDVVGESDAETQEFAKLLFNGFCANREAIDAAIDSRLDNWNIQRLAVLDRTILRLGAFELMFCPATPPKVAINEYIELAKTYGSEGKTTKLVNGVLDRIAKEHRAAEVPGATPSKA